MEYTIEGLSDQEVEAARQQHGWNQIAAQNAETFLEKYIGNFKDPIITILIVALAINVVLAFLGFTKWYESLGIGIAVLLATFVATFSEFKNETSFQKLQEEASKIHIKVFRNGSLQVLNIEEAVVGDSVLLQPGDKVPADCVVLSGKLGISQAAITGEPEPVTKYAPPQVDSETTGVTDDLLDPHTIFRGTVVTEGEALVKVVAVGERTVYGRLAGELNTEVRESPLQVKLGQLALGISKFGYYGATFIAVSFMFKKVIIDNNFIWNNIVASLMQWQFFVRDLVTAIILAVIIIVVAVPEGLPMMIAIVLSLNMRKLLNVKVLVRKLIGIETAGSLNILFVDKTGTITHGKLEAVTFVTASGESYQAYRDIPEPLRMLLYLGVRYNNSCIISLCEAGKEQIVGGNPTERSLMEYVQPEERFPQHTLKQVIPFSSDKKYSLSQVEGEHSLTLVKGAPEVILSHCKYYYTTTGEKKPLTDRQSVEKEINQLSNRAMRVIAIASSETAIDQFSINNEHDSDGGTLIGFVGIRDDVRAESSEAIQYAHQAGIQVVMMTGDKRETAMAIARDCGLLKSPDDLVFSSKEINQMSDHQLKEALPNIRVIERALPSDKSRLVRIAQEAELVVGMTGDGVNDAPALHQADVGFSMGSGTEVAKEAGDIIVLDDNFLSITRAVHYGRTIYNTIRKFIVFQLTVNLAAILIAFLGPFFGYDLPLTMIQLLWVNLVMDTLAALALGGESALKKYMAERPKKRTESIISRMMWSSILINGVVIATITLVYLVLPQFRAFFRTPEAFMTSFFTLFIFLNSFNIFNARTEEINLFDHILENKGFLKIVAVIFLVQISFTYVGGEIMRTVPMTLSEWLIVISIALIIIPVDLLRKTILSGTRERSFHAASRVAFEQTEEN